MRRAFFNVMLRVKSVITTLFSNQKSLTLNGTSQYVSVADSNSLSFGDSTTDSPFTFTAWIKPTDATLFPILDKDSEYLFGMNGADRLELDVIDNGTGNRTFRSTLSTLTSYEGKWTHVAGSWEPSTSTIKLYINGSDDSGTQTTSGTYVAMHNTANVLRIGSRTNFSTQYAGGLLDQVVIWDKVLSISEVKEAVVLRDLTQHSAYANIVSWYEFDDADVSGTTVSDRVGSNDGTMVNSPTRTKCVPFPYSYQLNTTDFFDNATPFTDGSTSTLTPYGGFGWDFDGTNEYITIPDGTGLSFTDGAGNDEPFSFSTWISIPNMATQNQIFSKSSGSFEYDCFMVSSQLYIRIYGGGLSNNYLQARVAVSEFPQDKKFLLTITYDGSNTNTGIKIYSNKRLLSTTNSTSGSYLGISNTASPIYIARRSYLYTTMQAYSFAIYNKELSSTEVGEVYNNHEPRDETLSSLSGNLSGYWRGYNSTNTASGVLDQSGNANHGTMTNMEDTDIVYSYPREAFDLANGNEGSVDFDGVNEYVTVADNATLSPAGSAFSLAVWVKADSRGMRFINKVEGTTAEWRWEVTGAGNYRIWLYDTDTSNYIGRSKSTLEPTSDSNWRLAVMTFDGSTLATGIKLYWNTTRVDDTTNNSGTFTGMKNTSAYLTLGALDVGTVFYGDGKMNHASVIGKELSLCEIQELYNDGSPVDPTAVTFASDFVSYWALDGRDDLTTSNGVLDLVGTNTGTAQNMVAGNLSTTDYPTN